MFRLTVSSTLCTPIPFYYKVHRKGTEEYQALVAAGKHFRTAIIPYSTTRRVLERGEYGMILPVKDYYSLVRTPLNQVDHTHAANALLLVEDHGFIFRCRVEVEGDLEGRVISRKLAQVFFVHPDQITWSAIYDRMYHDHRWYLQHQCPCGCHFLRL
jgi:hypothetical protein